MIILCLVLNCFVADQIVRNAKLLFLHCSQPVIEITYFDCIQIETVQALWTVQHSITRMLRQTFPVNHLERVTGSCFVPQVSLI